MLGWQADTVWVGEPAVRLNHDIIIFHQAVLDEHVERIVERARATGCILVYDMDDLTVGADFVRHQAYKHGFDAKQMLALVETTRRREALLRLCDACLVSTDYLATVVAAYVPKPYILRNALGRRDLEIAATVTRHAVAADGRVVLGYMSGTASHNYDFAEIANVLGQIMERYPQVYLQVTGPLEIPKTLDRFGHRVRQLPIVPWEYLYGIIASVDINLAPLELGEPFCMAKSEVKYMEAGLVGVPTIASSIGAFQYAIHSGENGLLANTAAEWLQALEHLIKAPDLIMSLGKAAREDVLERYHPAKRSVEVKAILGQLSAGNGTGSTPLSDPDRMSALVVRHDFGIPIAQRPPLFPPTRHSVKVLLQLLRRRVVYEGLSRTLWHLATWPLRIPGNLWQRTSSIH